MGKIIVLKSDTYNQLSKIKHDTASKVNKDVTFDDSVKLLIAAYEKSHKHEVPA
jgi:hypothetical protein